MSNLFDSANYPDSIPAKLVSGNRWAWTAADLTADYPTASYTLKYRLSLQTADGLVKVVTASKVSSAHVVEVASATTAQYESGDYYWQAIIVRDSDSEEVTVDSGMCYVLPNLSDEPGDTRSHTLKVLRAIQACIEGTATKEDQSYSIAGRSLARRSIPELLELLSAYEKKWEREKDEIAKQNGRPVSRRVLAKMSA